MGCDTIPVTARSDACRRMRWHRLILYVMYLANRKSQDKSVFINQLAQTVCATLHGQIRLLQRNENRGRLQLHK